MDPVDLDEVHWTDPPEREEAGSPNVVGAVALDAAIGELQRIGWDAIVAHDDDLARALRDGLAAIDGVTLLGPTRDVHTLPLATFTVAGMHHALVAARLSVEHGIGVRHGCFCAHPYLLRLLNLSPQQVADYHAAVRAGDRRATRSGSRKRRAVDLPRRHPGLPRRRAPDRRRRAPPFDYEQDPHTGDYWPTGDVPGWTATDRMIGASCARG
jgi:hypothetical protein